MAERVYYTHEETPIGRIRLRACDRGLIALDHINQQEPLDEEWVMDESHPILVQAISELSEYFEGKRKTFETPLAPRGTGFQLEVWQALQAIPYAETASYSDIADEINNPKAVRAVGSANGKNPLSIFIPCHRIVGKNGSLTGYAGGLDNKSILLKIEQKYGDKPNSTPFFL